MKYDYINDIFLTLMKQNRTKEAEDFCKKIIAEAPGVEFRCMAYKNLAELYFHHTGDGVGVRNVCSDALRELDSNPDVIENSKHVSPNGMKTLYCDLCALMRDVAITFDEYKENQSKKWKYKPSGQEEIRTANVEMSFITKGTPWIENIMSHAGSYWQNQAYSQAAVYLSLALEFKRELKLSREDMNSHVLPFYPLAICNIITGSTSACIDRRQEVLVSNYEFIAETAISRLKDCEDSRIADYSVVEESIKILKDYIINVKNNRELEKSSGYIGNTPKPTEQEIYSSFDKEMELLKSVYLRSIGENTPQNLQKIPFGCSFLMLLILLGVVGYYWYAALIEKSHGALSWILAIISSLLLLTSLISVIKNRWK
jgi:hypothetical protein